MSELRIGRGFSLPLDVVTEAVGIVATRGAGKSYTSAVLLEETHSAGVPFVVIDPNGVYWGLRSNAKGDGPGLPVYVLGGPHGDLGLEPHAGKLIADVVVDSGHSFVLDLSDMPTKAAARGFVADFLERLHRAKSRQRTTLLLVVDEADEFAPQNPRGETARSLGAMETIAKRGRAFGLGIVMITQRTQALNKDVLDLIETLLAMRQLSERSRNAVKGWIADKDLRDELGVIESLPSLPTGTAWAWSPVREVLQKVAVRRIRTFDSYATPKPGERRVEPTSRTQLDLGALGEQMRATVERAKANDPAELRREIRELRKQLETRPVIEKPIVESADPEIVEVSVLRDADLDELRSQLDRLFGFRDELLTTLHDVAGAASVLLEQAQRATGVPPAERRPPSRPQPTRETPRWERPVRALSDTLGRRSAGGDGNLTGPQQRVLNAIAWLNAIGFGQPTKLQVGFIAGYRVGKKVGGTYGNILGQIHTNGLIRYPTPGQVELTDAGEQVADVPDIEMSDEGLQQAIYARLDGPERRVLQVLVDVHPRPLAKQEVGERAGYTVGPKIGGTFGNILGRLRSLGLIEYPAPGLAVAEPVLFLDGSRA